MSKNGAIATVESVVGFHTCSVSIVSKYEIAGKAVNDIGLASTTASLPVLIHGYPPSCIFPLNSHGWKKERASPDSQHSPPLRFPHAFNLSLLLPADGAPNLGRPQQRT